MQEITALKIAIAIIFFLIYKINKKTNKSMTNTEQLLAFAQRVDAATTEIANEIKGALAQIQEANGQAVPQSAIDTLNASIARLEAIETPSLSAAPAEGTNEGTGGNTTGSEVAAN